MWRRRLYDRPCNAPLLLFQESHRRKLPLAVALVLSEEVVVVVLCIRPLLRPLRSTVSAQSVHPKKSPPSMSFRRKTATRRSKTWTPSSPPRARLAVLLNPRSLPAPLPPLLLPLLPIAGRRHGQRRHRTRTPPPPLHSAATVALDFRNPSPVAIHSLVYFTTRFIEIVGWTLQSDFFFLLGSFIASAVSNSSSGKRIWSSCVAMGQFFHAAKSCQREPLSSRQWSPLAPPAHDGIDKQPVAGLVSKDVEHRSRRHYESVCGMDLKLPKEKGPHSPLFLLFSRIRPLLARAALTILSYSCAHCRHTLPRKKKKKKKKKHNNRSNFLFLALVIALYKYIPPLLSFSLFIQPSLCCSRSLSALYLGNDGTSFPQDETTTRPPINRVFQQSSHRLPLVGVVFFS